MKNPLHKRYKRELRQDLGKYIAIFLFMVLSIGFISGFLVAGTSMKTAYNQSFKKYNIEDGHFILKKKADKDLIKTLEDELGFDVLYRSYQGVSLTPKEYDLLLLFLHNPNAALYRDTIYERVWGGELAYGSKTVDLHVQRLRKKVGWEKALQAVNKIGYRLETPL